LAQHNNYMTQHDMEAKKVLPHDTKVKKVIPHDTMEKSANPHTHVNEFCITHNIHLLHKAM